MRLAQFRALIRWIISKLTTEVQDAELDVRQSMLDRTCTQGDKSVTQYANALKRAVRDIPGVADKELIIWFLNGSKTGIAHNCKCDTRGKPWKRYNRTTFMVIGHGHGDQQGPQGQRHHGQPAKGRGNTSCCRQNADG